MTNEQRIEKLERMIADQIEDKGFYYDCMNMDWEAEYEMNPNSVEAIAKRKIVWATWKPYPNDDIGQCSIDKVGDFDFGIDESPITDKSRSIPDRRIGSWCEFTLDYANDIARELFKFDHMDVLDDGRIIWCKLNP